MINSSVLHLLYMNIHKPYTPYEALVQNRIVRSKSVCHLADGVSASTNCTACMDNDIQRFGNAMQDV